MGQPQTYRAWTDDEDAHVRRRVADNATTGVIADELGRPYKSVEQRIGALGCRRFTRQVVTRPNVSVLAPITTAPESDDVFFDRVLDQTDRATALAQDMRYATLRIESDRPIGISLSADWHLTAKGPTRVRALKQYAEGVRDTDRAYALGVGDMMDNPIKHKPSSVNDIPDDLRLLDIMLGRFGGKMLGMTSGNHDDWTKALVGVDNLKSMAERHQLHYAPDELIWSVEIVAPGTDTVTGRWVIATRHQFRRHSNLNHTHACWRWLEENEYNWPTDAEGKTLLPDVVAIGHNHVAAVEQRTYEGRDVVAIRMGSWQYTSPYTRAGGWALMPPTAPVVILAPTRDEPPRVFPHWQQGLEALAKL